MPLPPGPAIPSCRIDRLPVKVAESPLTAEPPSRRCASTCASLARDLVPDTSPPSPSHPCQGQLIPGIPLCPCRRDGAGGGGDAALQPPPKCAAGECSIPSSEKRYQQEHPPPGQNCAGHCGAVPQHRGEPAARRAMVGAGAWKKKSLPPPSPAPPISEEAGTLPELPAAGGGNNPALCGSCREKKPPRNAGEVRQPQAAFCPAGRVLGRGGNGRDTEGGTHTTQTTGPLRWESGQEPAAPAARAERGVRSHRGVRRRWGGGYAASRHKLPHCWL